MNIDRLKQLSGVNGGKWKEVNTTSKTPKSQSKTKYNTDTKNKSATDVRDADKKADIDQDVAVTMDKTTPDRTEEQKGEVEQQNYTISIDDNGAPKVDDTTEVTTSKPDSIANEGVVNEASCQSMENEEETEETEDEDLKDNDKELSDDSSEDDKERADESAGNVERFAKSKKTLMSLYSVSEDEANHIIRAIRGSATKAAAKALVKIFPSSSIKTAEDVHRVTTDLFDQHPELQHELMEMTKFERSFKPLKEYFLSAKKSLTESSDRVVVKVDTDNVNASGTSKKGQIKTPGHVLTEIFGEPQHLNDGDVNFMWEIEFTHHDQSNPDDDDTTVVSIYDWRYHTGTQLSEIDVWNVGAHSGMDVWMLEDYIKSKGGEV